MIRKRGRLCNRRSLANHDELTRARERGVKEDESGGCTLFFLFPGFDGSLHGVS